jgi:hypothetical protein
MTTTTDGGETSVFPMRHFVRRVFASQEIGLVLVLVLVTATLTALAGTHPDRQTGEIVNNFWNS